MSVEWIIDKVTEYYSWLYYRDWQSWEWLTIAIVAVALLVLVARAWLKARASAHIRQLRERTPVIGLKLAERGGRQ